MVDSCLKPFDEVVNSSHYVCHAQVCTGAKSEQQSKLAARKVCFVSELHSAFVFTMTVLLDVKLSSLTFK